MKRPDFRAADRTARVCIDRGQAVPDITVAALSLRCWWTLPQHIRTTAACGMRRAAIRRWVAEIRACLRHAQPEAAR